MHESIKLNQNITKYLLKCLIVCHIRELQTIYMSINLLFHQEVDFFATAKPFHFFFKIAEGVGQKKNCSGKKNRPLGWCVWGSVWDMVGLKWTKKNPGFFFLDCGNFFFSGVSRLFIVTFF